MSNITDWIKYELYPSLFERIDQALPEFSFRKKGRNWVSGNKLKITGEQGDSVGKVYIWENAPGFIKDFTRETSSIVDYVIKRDGVEFIQAVRALADIAGLQLPNSDSWDSETYQKYKEKATLLEDCNSYFTWCLENAKGAEEVRAYLQDERGYSLEDIKAMELGFIPGQEKLFKYLTEKGYSSELVDEAVKIKTDTRIGSTHSLTIPYRSGGTLKGFKFRTTGDTTPKYLNTSGLDKSGGFFNLTALKGDKDLIVVEGELDSLHATVKGIENVVAITGSGLNSELLQDAKKRGAKAITLCYDMEPEKALQTEKRIRRDIEIILQAGLRAFVITLPDLGGGKTDPDRLIKEKGAEAFKKEISEALSYFLYILQAILNKYGRIQKERALQSKDIDNLLEEIVEAGVNIKEPTDRDRYKKLLSMPELNRLGITEESLSITIDRFTSTRDKEAQERELKRLLLEATAYQDKGEPDKALEILESKVREVRLRDKATEYSKLLLPIKEAELRERLKSKPDSLNSGYTIAGEELLLPSGALSVITAPTSHGKTTFLINLALNVAKTYPAQEVYLFSYEEDSDSILINALNTYLDEELNNNNRRSIKSYFTTGNTEYINKGSRDSFLKKKDKFFTELIATRRLNINYPTYNSDELIEGIRYLKKNTNIGSVFIDYIQLLNLPQGKYKTYSRQEEIKEICIALKDLAVETGLPIILGAQFNREVVNQLKLHATKIGEAGDIERIANVIVGFWNNNFKPIATDSELREINEKGATTPDTLYTVILKNRGGRVGLTELLEWNGNTGVIKNKANSYF